eukprot:SRR837773.17882.p1 GENE.SRR837773.17882~~SRR837773.17882.p1  ORF type:complete len:488 (+),score=52.88 SRR837773.17882:2-1465(+)
MQRTLAALPKISSGRLGPRAVRYMVQRYFSGTYGWLISGLELQFQPVPAVNLSSKVEVAGLFPVVLEQLFESRRQGEGLSVTDLASMVYLLEHLVVHESALMLDAAYDIYGLDVSSKLPRGDALEVLASFLALIRRGQERQSDQQTEAEIARELEHVKHDLTLGESLAKDVLLTFDFARRHRASPFCDPTYTYGDVVFMARSMVKGSGARQRDSCQKMKADLVDLDPERTGSVPLGAFYAHSSDDVFMESIEYLEASGSLDRKAGEQPRVRVANYLLSPGLCIASSMYSSSCCPNECDALMADLEEFFRAPLADPVRLLHFVGNNLSSNSIDAPRVLSPALAKELESIAKRHGGQVPLHGRLFAQWFHAAFPYECPYPHIVAEELAARVSYWAGLDYRISAEERHHLVEDLNDIHEVAFDSVKPLFDDLEFLPLEEPKEHQAWRDFVRWLVLLAVLVAVLRIMYCHFRGVSAALRCATTDKTLDLVC